MQTHVRRKPLLCQGYQAVGSYFYLIAIPPCKSFQGPTTGTWLQAPMWTTSIPCRLALKIHFQGPVAKTQPSHIQAYMCTWLLKKVRICVCVYVYVRVWACVHAFGHPNENMNPSDFARQGCLGCGGLNESGPLPMAEHLEHPWNQGLDHPFLNFNEFQYFFST